MRLMIYLLRIIMYGQVLGNILSAGSTQVEGILKKRTLKCLTLNIPLCEKTLQ